MTKLRFAGRVATCAFAFSVVSTLAVAHEYALDSLRIIHPSSRPAPAAAPTAAGYMSITNTGKVADRLIGGSTPASDKLEIHRMSMTGGVMEMDAVASGIVLAPGATVTFTPVGYHFMFVGLKQPFRTGDHIPATLRFEHAGSVDVEFYVEQPSATAAPPPGMAMPTAGAGM
jgi:periplasmic copper chaperone A